MTLNKEQIDNLPPGAKYQSKDGNATGTVTKTDTGLEFTADCDSLIFIAEYLFKEVYRFQSENTALQSSLKEQKVTEVNKLTGLQYFQIYGFRIICAILIIIAVVFTFNKFDIWQKMLKILKTFL